MTIRPFSQIDQSTPDNTNTIVGDRGQKMVQDAVGKALNDIQQLRTRATLGSGEFRQSFGVLFDSRAGSTSFPNVLSPLQPGDTEQLIHFETATPMPYQPAQDLNFIFTRQYFTLDAPARVDLIINGDLIDSIYADGGGVTNEQTAELFELAETVSNLDGSHTLTYEVTPLTNTEVEGTVFFRALEREVQ